MTLPSEPVLTMSTGAATPTRGARGIDPLAMQAARRRGRSTRVALLTCAVVLAHAGAISLLVEPRGPSGRGQSAVASALTIRSVAVVRLESTSVPLESTQGPAAKGPAEAAPTMPPVSTPASAKPSLEPWSVQPALTHRPVAARSTKQPSAALPSVEPRDAPRPAAQLVPARSAAPLVREVAAIDREPTRARAVVADDRAPATEAADGFDATALGDSTDPSGGEAQALAPQESLRALPSYLVRLPPSQRLVFRVSRGEASGEGVLDWTRHGEHYRASLRLRGQGLPGVDWTSEGEAAGETGVLPRRMVAHRKGRPVAAANFAPEEGRVSFSGQRTEQPFVRGGQDRLTWLLQLAGVLNARSQPLRDDEPIVLYVVGPRGAAELWQWRVVGHEALSEGDATTSTVKLVRQAQRLYDTEYELWLDPANHHLPLKWRQQQRGVARPALEWARVPG